MPKHKKSKPQKSSPYLRKVKQDLDNVDTQELYDLATIPASPKKKPSKEAAQKRTELSIKAEVAHIKQEMSRKPVNVDEIFSLGKRVVLSTESSQHDDKKLKNLDEEKKEHKDVL